MAKPRPQETVGIKELKDQASSIVERVQRTRRPVTVTKNGRDVVRIVSIAEAGTADGVRQRLTDLGLLARPAQASVKELKLEKLGLDSTAAISAILADRGED